MIMAQTPSQESAPSSTTLLDALRRRLMPEVNAGAAQRLSDIGVGMLASGSPDFFTALGKGLQAGNTAETNRLQMLRQAAETEEQSADRKARLELQRRQLEYEQDPTNPRTRAALMQAEAAVRSADAAMARASREVRDQWQVIGTDQEGNAVVVNTRDPSQRQTLTGVQPTSFGVASLRASGAGAGREDQNWLRALSQARQEAASNLGFSMLPQQEQSNWIDRRARQLYDTRPSQAGTPAAPAAPAAQPTTRLNLTGPLPPRQPTAPTE
jgi:hypothetical protein